MFCVFSGFWGWGSEIILYSALSQAPRSTNLHLSEQKGKNFGSPDWSLIDALTIFRHIGHLCWFIPNPQRQLPDRKGRSGVYTYWLYSVPGRLIFVMQRMFFIPSSECLIQFFPCVFSSSGKTVILAYLSMFKWLGILIVFLWPGPLPSFWHIPRNTLPTAEPQGELWVSVCRFLRKFRKYPGLCEQAHHRFRELVSFRHP